MSYRVGLVVAAALFAGGAAFGLVTPATALRLLARDIAALQEFSHWLADMPPLTVAIVIFAKNAFALVLSFAFSPLLCLMPVLALAVNGWLLGWVAATLLEKESLGLLLAGVLPHGIVEIPAFIIGEAAALSFGSLLILAVFRKSTRSQLRPRLGQSLKFLLLALALLLPAAFIEAFVTASLVKGG